MHQHTHQHAVTPILHQSSTTLPALMGTQDSKFNPHLLSGTTRPSFAPVTPFHRATQKSFRSTKQGRWGALHVCIAWKIYYHKQLKRMQQKPSSLHQELTPEYPATCPPDSVQHKESDQPSSRHPNLDSPCGHPRKTSENRSCPSDLYTSSPCHSRATKREKLDWEKLEQQPILHWKEKLIAKEKQTDTAKDFRDKSWDRAATPELDIKLRGSLDRKRPPECDSFMKVKRVKQEIVDDQLDSSKTLHADSSSHILPVQHTYITDLSVLYPHSSRCNFSRTPGRLVCYPGAEMHPYQTAAWEPMWDLNKRFDHHTLKDYSVNTCKAVGIPPLAQRQKEAFHGFFASPLYFPLALREQETVYLRGREFLHSHDLNCHLHRCRQQLPHPGFLPGALSLQSRPDRKGEQLLPLQQPLV